MPPKHTHKNIKTYPETMLKSAVVRDKYYPLMKTQYETAELFTPQNLPVLGLSQSATECPIGEPLRFSYNSTYQSVAESAPNEQF